jgi:predicted alpha-1,2-mannosidase
MKQMFFSALMILFISATTSAQSNNKVAASGNFTHFVNPFIGTGAVKGGLSGNAYPGATMPFGMVQLSPDTRATPDWDAASGYDYNDSKIYGFSHTHLSGTGASDLIDILLLPVTSAEPSQGGDKTPCSTFSHQEEEASPGYYRVMLKNGNINAELSATTHVGIHRYMYPQGSPMCIFFDLDHSAQKGSWNRRIIQSQIRIVSPTVIEGYRIITGWAKLRRIYFHAEFSRPMTKHTILDGDHQYSNAETVNGTSLRAYLSFDSDQKYSSPADGNSSVKCKVALSTVSSDNARLNMEQEAADWNFDGYRKQADKTWNKFLGRIEVEGDSTNQQIFYTALYHALIQPNQLSDVNGDYVSAEYTIGKLPQAKEANNTGRENQQPLNPAYFSTFSLWDTYRAAHPLYTIIAPEQNAQFVNSMLLHFDDYGYLPIWDLWGQDNYCMIGNHAVPVIVDAYLKGTIPADKGERILKAVAKSCSMSHPGLDVEAWEKYGYMPENVLSQSVSITLEQSFDDWCVAQLAKKLGDQNIYDHFTKRSLFWRNLYNPSSGFFQAKDDKGNWIQPFNPLRYGGNGGNPYTEGNAWQWTWYVPQDIQQLMSISGGKPSFIKKLDTFFTLTNASGEKNSNASGFIGQYIHGNEPDHHVAYLYDYAGQPRKTQELVNRIMRKLYNTNSDGYAGNDDCGEMSSWFIFSALGFYPVCPVGGEMAIGTPLFESATIHLQNGKTFRITANRKSADDIYIRKMTLNGKPLHNYFINYNDIINGGVLNFDMTK